MSWNLYLGDESPVDGHTYNLTSMWVLSGMVSGATRELDGLTGREIATRAERAVRIAVTMAPAFEAINPQNGWGDYDGFLEVLIRLWRCAARNPGARASWSG